MEGQADTKDDPLLGLDESWKNWLRPPNIGTKERKSLTDQSRANGDSSLSNNCEGEMSDCIKDESKENVFIEVEPDIVDDFRTMMKQDPSMEEDSAEDMGVEGNKKNSLYVKSVKYESVLVKAYYSAIIKEEPLDELTKIFEESALEFEKKKFHQQVINEVMEDLNNKDFECLQNEYISKLREVANIEIFNCSSCDFQTMNHSNLKSHLYLIHKTNSLKVKMYKCIKCTFRTNSLATIKKHECEVVSDNDFSDFNNEYSYSPDDSEPLSSLVRKKKKRLGINKRLGIKKCDLCEFEGEDRKSLEQHYITHKDPDNLRTFLCYMCHYECRYKRNLKKHLFKVHKIKTLDMDDNDSGKIYKCDQCEYKTDIKKHLETHSLIHKNGDELELFSCNVCDFKTKNKPYLKIHSLIHKNPEEIEKKYMCEICSKKFRVKSKLQFHLLTHKSNDEVELFACGQCDYRTKLKYNLKIHSEIHSEPAYVCDTCGLQSRRKWNHEMHLLTHKKDEEVQVFKCAVCSYQTKFKDRLKRHLAKGTHFGNKKQLIKRQRKSKFMSEPKEPVVKVKKKFICDVCGIKCSQKSALNTHALKHKSPEEIRMHRCNHCGYETRIKGNLTNHMKIHKDPSEFPTFKCDTCGLISKNKWNHKMHLLTHKSTAECELFSCTICSYQTKFRAYLREHLKKRHNINTAGKPGRPPVNAD